MEEVRLARMVAALSSQKRETQQDFPKHDTAAEVRNVRSGEVN